MISFGFLSLGARRQRTLVAAAEVTLVIILAVQAARLGWILLAPVGPIGAVPATTANARGGADMAILSRFDPFFRVGEAQGVQAAAAAGQDGLRLSGVRTDGRGGGSAIIRTADGREASYLVGETVEQGLVLTSVQADHVILSRGGARQRIGFPATVGMAPAPVTSQPARAPAPAQSTAGAGGQGAVPAKQLLAAAALAPRAKDGRTQGYRLMPRGGEGADVLGRAGLKAGDVITAIDGEEFNAERLQELPDQLSKSEWVDLRIERDGQTLTTRVRISPR